ncbi:hypothetical protein GGX14DRAFT_369443, partial [Mycena pura]
TDAQLKACASLFSSNYGVWSSPVSAPLEPGELAIVFRAWFILDVYKHVYKQVFLNVYKRLSAWTSCSDIGWITQLVGVSHDYRQRGIATSLLRLLPGPNFKCGAFGLVSSHPAACLAHANVSRVHAKVRKLNLDFIKTHAQKTINTTNISYLKNAQLRNSLLRDAAEPGVVACAFTAFYVDHEEPFQALKSWEDHRQDISWPLGVLKGHEFFCITPNKEVRV